LRESRRAAAWRPHVVDQYVEPIARGGHQAGGTVGLGQVDDDRLDRSPVDQLGQLGADRSRPGDDPGAFLNETAGDRQADAFAGTGHDRDFAAQTQFHAHSSHAPDVVIKTYPRRRQVTTGQPLAITRVTQSHVTDKN
jgi:hypothetical protein